MAILEMFLMIIWLASLVEAVVQVLKPLWAKSPHHSTITTIVSIVIGIVTSFATQKSIFEALNITAVASSWLSPFGYIITGILISRNGAFMHDLWKKMTAVKLDNTTNIIKNETVKRNE